MNMDTFEESTAFNEACNDTPTKVLILDDESSIAELLSEMLEMFGYQTRQCFTPKQALEILGEEKFDVVLSDYRMPQMNGQQFYFAAIEKSPELAKRIVFLTGDVVNEETQAFLKATGNPHLSKPFQASTVARVITQVLEQSALAA